MSKKTLNRQILVIPITAVHYIPLKSNKTQAISEVREVSWLKPSQLAGCKSRKSERQTQDKIVNPARIHWLKGSRLQARLASGGSAEFQSPIIATGAVDRRAILSVPLASRSGSKLDSRKVGRTCLQRRKGSLEVTAAARLGRGAAVPAPNPSVFVLSS